MSVITTRDKKILTYLESLLDQKGMNILNGSSLLCLTSEIIIIINRALDHYNNSQGTFSRSNVIIYTLISKIRDFLSHSPTLKLIHNSVTIIESINLVPFSSLTHLEIKKVPIHLLIGLHTLRTKLRVLSCAYCVKKIQDVIETCAADRCVPLSWSELRDVRFSTNSITALDSSLRLLPLVEKIDVSHNNIISTDKFFEYLTEVDTVNLGYNKLTSVPSMSISARARLRSLILRNNNIDSLSGVELLMNLIHLDVSYNCISDHHKLSVLKDLDRLNTLWIIGNPISFHKYHRFLSVGHLSSTCKYRMFLLDGKALTPDEKDRLPRNVGSYARRPSTQSDFVISSALDRNTSAVKQRPALPIVNGSKDLSRSLPNNNLYQIGDRKDRRRRRKMKMRHAVITELESSGCLESSSRDSSPGCIPTDDPSKRNYELMRDHYGSHWLSLFNRNTVGGSPAPIVPELNDNSTSTSTSDDPGSTTESQDVTDSVIKSVPTVFVSQDSVQGVEWQRNTEENLKAYGDESEPILATADTQPDSHLFLTVDDRYLRERDEGGTLVEILDLHLLKDVECHLEDVSDRCHSDSLPYKCHTDEVLHNSQLLIKLTFDYVKKNRRQRIYHLDSKESMLSFQRKLMPHVMTHRLKKLRVLECLKCSLEFTSTVSSSEDEADVCPKCGSALIVEAEMSTTTTPVGSTTSSDDFKIKTSTPRSCSKRRNSKNSTDKDVKQVNKSDVTSATKKLFSIFTHKKHRNVDVEYDHASSAPNMNKVHSMPCLDYKLVQDIRDSDFTSSLGNSRNTISAFYSGKTPINDINPKLVIPSQEIDSDMKDLIHENEANDELSKCINIANSSQPVEKVSFCISPDDDHVDYTAEVVADKQHLQNQTDSILQKSESKESLSLKRACVDGSLEVIGSEHSLEITRQESFDQDLDSPLSSVVCNSLVSSVYSNVFNGMHNNGVYDNDNSDINTVKCSTHFLSTAEFSTIRPDLSKTHKVNGCIESNEPIVKHVTPYHTHPPGDSCTTSHEMRTKFEDCLYESLFPITSENKAQSDENGLLTNEHEDKCVNNSHIIHSNQNKDIPSDINLVTSKRTEQSYIQSSTIPINDGIKVKTKTVLSPTDLMLTRGNKYYGCDENFNVVDHRLKLFLIMSLFTEEQEEFQCMLKCQVVQYNKPQDFGALLVFSTQTIYILKIINDLLIYDDLQSCLECIESQPIVKICYIDIGLGYQSFRIEFAHENGSYTFITMNEGRCRHFVGIITGIIQGTALSDQSQLVSITKHNPETLENFNSQVLIHSSLDSETNQRAELVKYMKAYVKTEKMDRSELVSVVATRLDLFIVDENHQWPLPRLQVAPHDEVMGLQFIIRLQQSINNIIELTLSEDRLVVKLIFLNDDSHTRSWLIGLESQQSSESLITAIKAPWETEFGVTLDISKLDMDETTLVKTI